MIKPVEHQVRVAVSPADAFQGYVERIGEWWHPRYSRDGATLRSVTIEPFVGGRVYATDATGEDDWGVVRVCEPGRLLVHSFWLAQDPDHPSEVSVEFVADPAGTQVNFSHGGWNEGNAAVRSKFGDWSVMLERYRAVVEG